MRKIRFADYLNDYLEFYNISIDDFANTIGITPKHLTDILSKRCNLSPKVIDAISKATNISCDYIYRIEGKYKIDSD